jgi:hypothetical protein
MNAILILKTLVPLVFIPGTYYFFQTIFSGINTLVGFDPADAESHKTSRTKLWKWGIVAIIATEIVVRLVRVKFHDSHLFHIHAFCFTSLVIIILAQFTFTRETKNRFLHYVFGILATIFYLFVLVTGGTLLYRL